MGSISCFLIELLNLQFGAFILLYKEWTNYKNTNLVIFYMRLSEKVQILRCTTRINHTKILIWWNQASVAVTIVSDQVELVPEIAINEIFFLVFWKKSNHTSCTLYPTLVVTPYINVCGASVLLNIRTVPNYDYVLCYRTKLAFSYFDHSNNFLW